MKVPLRYQMTEYDCGPTSLLNAVSYLFPREEIPPEIVRSVMLYCLDCFGAADRFLPRCPAKCPIRARPARELWRSRRTFPEWGKPDRHHGRGVLSYAQ